MKGNTSWDRVVLLSFLLILIAFGALVARKYLTSSAPAPVPVAAEPKQRREVVLYFAAPPATYLVAETREIDSCLDERECLRAIVQELVHGPVGDLLPVFPVQAVVRDVGIAGEEATVDFSRDLIDNHPGGSVPELLTVYGLANTLAANFPDIRQVRILVEGAAVESLKGHVDLRQPVRADGSMLRPPQPLPAAAEPTGATPERN
jgi:spore germination protein GerM